MENRISSIILLSAAVMTCGSPAAGQKMYSCDGGTNTVNRLNLVGSGSEVVVSGGLSKPDGITLDPVNEEIYLILNVAPAVNSLKRYSPAVCSVRVG